MIATPDMEEKFMPEGWLKEYFDTQGEIVKGSSQVYPFLPCPLCGSDVNLVQKNSGLWYVDCPCCNLFFGLPNGYSSRVDMARDWNKRTYIATVANWIDPNDDWADDEN